MKKKNKVKEELVKADEKLSNKLLFDLYRINSFSRYEQEISLFVCEQLDKLGLKYTVDEEYQIYNIVPDTPMLCAHLDQVGMLPVKTIYTDKDKKIIRGDANLGADDKNGVWIVLKLLEHFKKRKISFIFSTCEEAGCNIKTVLRKKQSILDRVKYCLVFDRRGGSDIIGTLNSYCSSDLEEDIVEIGSEFGYKVNSGIFSDCDFISNYVPCVNLSCGYYKQHTEEEYTNISELLNALSFGKKIISTLHGYYSKPDKKSYYDYVYGYEIEEEQYYCRYCEEYVDGEDIIVGGSYTNTHSCPICYNMLMEVCHGNYKDEDKYEDFRSIICTYCGVELEDVEINGSRCSFCNHMVSRIRLLEKPSSKEEDVEDVQEKQKEEEDNYEGYRKRYY